MRRRAPLDLGFFIGVGCIALLSFGVGWWRDRELPALQSYGGAADTVRRNAAGGSLRFADFRGQPLLVVYGAPWCRDCPSQVAVLRQALPPDVPTLHVVTSTARGYGHPADVADARAWARRFNLPAERVLAADLSAKRLPALTLFDGEGRIVLDVTGLAEPAAVTDALRESGWREKGP